MWNVSKNDLTMAEGDYGIALPITINGFEFTAYDSVVIAIKKSVNGETILEKEYTDIQDNTINLEFTSAETELLPIGKYVYRIDIYQSGSFMCNVIPSASIKVVDKA